MPTHHRESYRDDYRALDQQKWESEIQFLDTAAARLAYGYLEKEFNFEFCSALMRHLKDYSAQRNWPPLFWEIFVALDAGEFYHNKDEPRDIEPSELHARPMIEAILSRLGQKPAE